MEVRKISLWLKVYRYKQPLVHRAWCRCVCSNQYELEPSNRIELYKNLNPVIESSYINLVIKFIFIRVSFIAIVWILLLLLQMVYNGTCWWLCYQIMGLLEAKWAAGVYRYMAKTYCCCLQINCLFRSIWGCTSASSSWQKGWGADFSYWASPCLQGIIFIVLVEFMEFSDFLAAQNWRNFIYF